MSGTKKVNIGTAERPIWVPEKALSPEGEDGREWWNMVAGGSVELEPEVLDRLLEKINEQKD